MQRTPAARARGIRKYYGDVVALERVYLEVEPGRVHGLVGPNGAGKTTLLGLLLGVINGVLVAFGKVPALASGSSATSRAPGTNEHTGTTGVARGSQPTSASGRGAA